MSEDAHSSDNGMFSNQPPWYSTPPSFSGRFSYEVPEPVDHGRWEELTVDDVKMLTAMGVSIE